MRRTATATVLAIGLFAAAAASASAATFCVPMTAIAGCPSGATAEPTVNDAVSAASSGDTVLVGAGTFNQSVSDAGKALHIVGTGQGQTTIQGLGVTALTVSAGSTVSDLTVDLGNGQGNTGISLAGTATRVSVVATQPANTMNNTGVDLVAGGSFDHGSVTLPMTTEANGFGGVVGNGTVSDSSITAPIGITADGAFMIPTVHRCRIAANVGVAAVPNVVTIDDSLIETAPGPQPETGIETAPSWEFAAVLARHVTVVGSGGAGSTGLSLPAFGGSGPAASTATLDSSIIRGYAHSIVASATAAPFPATSKVMIGYSSYDPATAIGGSGATITPDSHSGNIDPLFVNASAGDFHLTAGSPAVDAGDPAPAVPGESTTDLDGNARAVAGHHGSGAVADMGAFEFQPHPPTVTAAAGSPSVPVGTADTFAASGSDPDPGDAVTFAWSFDDGAGATGPSATHAFVDPGRHTATVTATDRDGFTASAAVAISVLARPVARPAITALAIAPASFRAALSRQAVLPVSRHPRRGTTVSYRDSTGASTTFTVIRLAAGHVRGHVCVARAARGRHVRRCTRHVVVGAFSHADTVGLNRFGFSGRIGGRRLAPGRYQLQAVARNAAGSSRAVLAGFRIVR